MNQDLTEEELKKVKWNPSINKDAITIIKQPDGNYRAFMWLHGKLTQIRAGDPNTALNMLITHE